MDKEPKRRHSMRLKGYDYATGGAYFVTICTHHREDLLGSVVSGVVRPSECGLVVQRAWNDLPGHYPHVALDDFVLMPNHVHGVLFLGDEEVVNDIVVAGLRPATTTAGNASRPSYGDAASTRAARRHSLSEIVRAFKTFSARRINALRGTPASPVWQRGFYDHVVRDEPDLRRIRQYVLDNPLTWDADHENLSVTPAGSQAARRREA